MVISGCLIGVSNVDFRGLIGVSKGLIGVSKGGFGGCSDCDDDELGIKLVLVVWGR